jgi:hypothetical protein
MELRRRELFGAQPKESLKINIRPGFVDTTGSLKVLKELDRFTGIKNVFGGTSIGVAICFDPIFFFYSFLLIT